MDSITRWIPFIVIAIIILITVSADVFIVKKPYLVLAKLPIALMGALAILKFRSFWLPAALGTIFVFIDFSRGDFQFTFVAFPLWVIAWFFLAEEAVSRLFLAKKQ